MPLRSGGTYGLQTYQQEAAADLPRSVVVIPLGAGFHITQAKIALGSGGVFGKGFLERHVRFTSISSRRCTRISSSRCWPKNSAWSAQLGTRWAIYGLILFHLPGHSAMRCTKTQFGRLVAAWASASTFFLYAFINLAMVTRADCR